MTSHRDDLISLILVGWQFSKLLEWMHLMTTVMNHKENRQWDEIIFSDSMEMECGHEETMTFRCFCNTLFHNASTVSIDSPIAEKMYYMNSIRGCFIIAFLYDLRVQRFVMTDHFVHTDITVSVPPSREKANLFMDAVKPLVDAFINRTISMIEMTRQSIDCWKTNYMFHRVGYTYHSLIDELGY
jgi:hypothetical protein